MLSCIQITATVPVNSNSKSSNIVQTVTCLVLLPMTVYSAARHRILQMILESLQKLRRYHVRLKQWLLHSSQQAKLLTQFSWVQQQTELVIQMRVWPHNSLLSTMTRQPARRGSADLPSTQSESHKTVWLINHGTRRRNSKSQDAALSCYNTATIAARYKINNNKKLRHARHN